MSKLFGGKKIPKWAIITGIATSTVLVLTLVLTAYTYSKSTVFSGISAGGVDLGGMTEQEAVKALDKECQSRFADAGLTVKVDDVSEVTVKASELGVKFSSADTAKKAFAIGREGGYFSRIFTVLGTVFTDTEMEVSMSFDEEILNQILAELAEKDIAPTDAAYTVEGEKLILHPKSDGLAIDKEKAGEAIKERFRDEDYSELLLKREVAPAAYLDLDKVYSEVHKEVADAYLEKNAEGNKITPHVVGVDFDLAAAKKQYEENPDRVIEIPLVLTQPKVLTKHLETNLFKYKLVEVETYFSPKKVERTANVRLAAQYVNGTILNPGEEFSYNEVVGPRTKARGFKEAAIFASGEVVDGIGGGICQVSSTIYMAAIKANMKITERKNHSFYVDYAPKGEDATVVYGSIDFKFVNTNKYPIKIVATSKNNYIRIAFMGTEPDEVRTVKLTKKTHSTTPYSTREKQTTELPAGERRVDQKGQQGLSMTVYRNVYDGNGKLLESYVENTSKYKPMPEIVLVGAGPEAVPTAPATPAEPTPEVKPEATPEPAPEVKPEQTPEVEPSTAPEVTPESPTVPEVTPEPEPTPEPIPEEEPEPTPEPAPETESPTAPETPADGTEQNPA